MGLLEGQARAHELADYRLAVLGSYVFGAQGVTVTPEDLLGRPLRYLQKPEAEKPEHPSSVLRNLLGGRP